MALSIPTQEKQIAQANAGVRKRIDDLNRMAWALMFEHGSESDRALINAFEARELAEYHDYTAGIANSYRVEALSRIFRSEYYISLESLWKALQLFHDIQDPVGEAYCHAGFGMVYANNGDLGKALSYYMRAIDFLSALEYDTEILGMCYIGLGTVYLDRQGYESAQTYFQKCYALAERMGSETGKARATGSLGALQLAQGQLEGARETCLKSLKLYEVNNNQMGLSRVMHDLGKIHVQTNDLQSARHFFEQALDIRTQIGYPQGQISSWIELGKLLTLLDERPLAFENLGQALEASLHINLPSKAADSHHAFAEAYKREGNFSKALEHFEAFHRLKLQTQQVVSKNQMQYIQSSLQIEKAQREKELYRMRNLELEQLNRDIEQALEMINDSLNYARRIQNVILPPEQLFQDDFSDSFIFYQPREIVSGDFYWHLRHNDQIFVAVVDCTGHGVPGAFMSMLGYSLLNHLVKDEGLVEPIEILRALDDRLTDVLRQRNDLSDVHDGMDAALVCFCRNGGKMAFAGANLPLTRIRDGVLTDFAGMRAPLGGSLRVFREKHFVGHQLELRPDDQYYLYSDGFRDQFGLTSAQKRKYSRQRFHSLLEHVHCLPMKEQQLALQGEFERWKGELRQVDDVVVVGVRW